MLYLHFQPHTMDPMKFNYSTDFHMPIYWFTIWSIQSIATLFNYWCKFF